MQVGWHQPSLLRPQIHRYWYTDNFSTLCYVRADLSPLAGSAQSKQGKNGKTYWTIVFNIEIHFGLTEFRARIKWLDNVSGTPLFELTYCL